MSKKLQLVSYPPLEKIAEQVSMPRDLDECFGNYTGQNPGVSIIDESIKNIDEVFVFVEIAPERMEYIESTLGRVVVTGTTRDREKVIVDINPFNELENLGSIFIEDSVE